MSGLQLNKDNPYRNSNNVLLLRGLFFETSANPDTVIYTLKDHEHKGFPSLKQLYLDTNDPTEYAFATNYLESWSHWELLCQASWFKATAEIWRKELELSYRSKALANIIKASKANVKESFQAAKYLAEKGWEKTPSSRGRPTKDQIAKEAMKIAEDDMRIEEDYERLKLVK